MKRWQATHFQIEPNGEQRRAMRQSIRRECAQGLEFSMGSPAKKSGGG
jgi:hypothetical protein